MMPEFEAGEHGHELGHVAVDTPTLFRDTQPTRVMIVAMRLVLIDLTPPTADAKSRCPTTARSTIFFASTAPTWTSAGGCRSRHWTSRHPSVH